MKKKVFSLNKEEVTKIKREGISLLFLLLLIIVIFKLVFFNELFSKIISMSLSLFWLFILPGFSIMYYWRASLDFLERLVIGTALGLGIVGSLSYYLGLIGLNIQYHVVLVPSLLILLGLFLSLREK